MRGAIHEPGRVIWKMQFEREVYGQIREMPRGWQPLDSALQDGIPTVWFTCEPSAELEHTRFWLCASGHDTPEEPAHFLGTMQFSAGNVWHLFVEERW